MIGGVVVTLTDAFFADPLALSVNYVIPLVMTDVKNADRILKGKASEGITAPNRFVADQWEVAPKDYILYAIKYINPWDVVYLRRGTDNITEDGVTRTEKRQGNYSPEEDEVIRLKSVSSTAIEFPVTNIKSGNVGLNMTLKLDFDPATQKCTFANGAWKNSHVGKEYASGNATFRVFDIAVSGTGEYRKNGEKNSWGSKDRDALYLNYQIEYKVEFPGSPVKTMKYETTDVLVFRDRGIVPETFKPVLMY